MQSTPIQFLRRKYRALRALGRRAVRRLPQPWLIAGALLAITSACGSCPADTPPPDAGDIPDTRPSLVLSFGTQDATFNCRSSDETGAGITRHTMTLIQNGHCVPVTFARARHGVIVGNYTVSCFRPSAMGCLETDETLLSPPLPAGDYAVSVRASVLAEECWALDDTLTVPANGGVQRRTLRLPRKPGGCSLGVSPASPLLIAP